MEEGASQPSVAANAAAAASKDLHKSYARSLERREAQLSQEAENERQVQQLSKVFQQQQEEFQRLKAERLAAQARENYERLMQRKQQKKEAEERFRDTVKIEREEVSVIIQDKWKQKQAEEEVAKQEDEKRRFLIQARTIYDKLRCEERRRTLEEQRTKYNIELRARLEKDEAEHREHREQRRKDASVLGDKMRARHEKARERRAQQGAEDRKAKTAGFTELEESHARAQELRNKELEAIRKQREEVSEQRLMRLKDLEDKSQAQRDEKRNKLFDKLRHVEERHERFLTEQQEALASSRLKREARLSAAATQKEEMQRQATITTRSVTQSPRQRPATPKMDEVHKAYLVRQAELEKKQEQMWTRKKYRAVAEMSSTKKSENLQTLRLRAVQSSYSAREAGEGTSRSLESTIRPGSESSDENRSSRIFTVTRRSAKELQQCALCERMFPPESLPGKALSAAVEKVKKEKAHEGKRRDGSTSLPPAQAASQSARDASPNSARGSDYNRTGMSSSRHSAKQDSRQLYDHAVPLCLTCYHYLHVVLM
mmetsp:Transcript_38851/g.91436  ORF Transcript_38851/g.91436 Transcript_38851/m.91436 type:complete len:543 (+) Transcript_38851:123-1751(+)